MFTIDHPDTKFNASNLFKMDCNWKIPGFSIRDNHVPEIDPNYSFDPSTTKAILAGFKFNRRVLIQGYHGTGKSSHLEQVAARLNWPCMRVNLDGHISRIDLIGKEGLVLRDGKQVTEFQPGILTWALTQPIALIFDEYDAGRADVMFVIQRILEQEGHLTLLDQNRVLKPHPYFRLFATTNTVGLGDATGLYQGTQILNQGQLDRWNIVSCLNYLPFEKEVSIVLGKFKDKEIEQNLIESMVRMAELTRQGFMHGDISTVMSPRTVINWAENTLIFEDTDEAFTLSFYNRCDETERNLLKEYYYRCFSRYLD